MGETTKIPWADATWNPWYGCRQVSEACDNCYFRERMHKLHRDPRIVTRAKSFDAVRKWSRKLRPGARIFTCSWGDFFIPEADEWRNEAWEIIKSMPQYNFLILTKRPYNLKSRLPSDWNNGYSNVWLGVTGETQVHVNERLAALSEIPTRVRFISIEPMLSRISLRSWRTTLDWVIAGGENGEKARPTHPDWIRYIAGECQEYMLPFYFKGWGKWLPSNQVMVSMPMKSWNTRNPIMISCPAGMRSNPIEHSTWHNAGKQAGDFVDGKQYHEFPERGIP